MSDGIARILYGQPLLAVALTPCTLLPFVPIVPPLLSPPFLYSTDLGTIEVLVGENPRQWR